MIFNLIKKLENYHKIIKNPNILLVIYSFFSFIEKMLVFNWKTNTLLGAFLILNVKRYERLKKFGKNKNKLAFMLFADKSQIEYNLSSNENSQN